MMGNSVMLDRENKIHKNRSNTDRDLVMTDVSAQAHLYGIKQGVMISPQVLIDIKDIPDGYEDRGENGVSRLRRILGSVRQAIQQNATLNLEEIPLQSILDRRSEEDITQGYDLVIRISPENSECIEIHRPNEEIDISHGMRTKVHALRKDLKPTRYPWGNLDGIN